MKLANEVTFIVEMANEVTFVVEMANKITGITCRIFWHNEIQESFQFIICEVDFQFIDKQTRAFSLQMYETYVRPSRRLQRTLSRDAVNRIDNITPPDIDQIFR